MYRHHPSRNVTEPISAVRIPVNTKTTSGLVLHLAADRDDVGRACRAKGILHTMGYAEILAKQDAHKEQGLRLKHAKCLHDDALDTHLERVELS